MTFGERLRELRQDRGLTQKQLGEELNTTQRKISYLETDKNEPSIEDLKLLCLFFEVSADYFLGLPARHKSGESGSAKKRSSQNH